MILSGAGLSAESGIETFRSDIGLIRFKERLKNNTDYCHAKSGDSRRTPKRH